MAAAALVLASACSVAPLSVPAREPAPAATLPASFEADRTPMGAVSVAYPDEPSALVLPTGTDVAADDLAALWGLPLVRVDDAGQVRRGLAEDWTVVHDDAEAWTVELQLRPGEWSDGSAVDSQDVAASLHRLRDEDPERFGVIDEVEGIDDHVVQIAFDGPYASWADLLVEAGSMQPSEVIENRDAALPVSGGPFVVTAFEAGLKAVFTAHTDGPLGPPGLEQIEVLFVPDYDTALGLLDADEVDAAVGYMAINPVSRAEELDGITAAAPLGGTMVSLRFRDGGEYGGSADADRRRGLAETIDVDELVEGMLGSFGAAAETPWPGVDLRERVPAGEVRDGQQITIVHPRDVGTIGFTARVVQRNLVARGVAAELVGSPAPEFQEVASSEHDAALTVSRTPRRPSLGSWLEDVDVVRAAGAAAIDADGAVEGLVAAATEARNVPLYRAGVLHAWRGVAGVRPSAWPGIGFWNVADWTLSE